MIKLGDKNVEPEQMLKVTKGEQVVWEKEVIKTLSWSLTTDIAPFRDDLPIPHKIGVELATTELLEVKIGPFRPISSIDIKGSNIEGIIFAERLNILLSYSGSLLKGTKITIYYK